MKLLIGTVGKMIKLKCSVSVDYLIKLRQHTCLNFFK